MSTIDILQTMALVGVCLWIALNFPLGNYDPERDIRDQRDKRDKWNRRIR